MRRDRRGGEDASSTVRRLAVMLAAGVGPPAAWRHVAEGAASEAARVLAGVAADAAVRGDDVATALAGAAPHGAAGASWRGLAAAWGVAERSGAALAPALDRFADALRDLREAHRDVEVALSGPRASARVVLVLPPVGLLLSLAMGFDVGRVLVGTAPGWACLAVATVLVLAAHRWSAALVRRATPRDALPGLLLELVAVALSGGAAWDGALAATEGQWRATLGEGPSADEAAEARSVLDLARRAGAPAGLLLRAAAEDRRRDARAAAAMAAERLGVALLVPLGACVLPAFVVVAVVPLVLALLSSTSWSG